MPCDAGYDCPTGATAANLASYICPAGYWCARDEHGAPVRKRACPFGKYATGTSGASTEDQACTACEDGFFCQGADRSKISCLAGHYCKSHAVTGATVAIMIKCPAGTYNVNTGSTSVSDCVTTDAGYFAYEGSSAQMACLPGHYCPNQGHTPDTILSCPGGTYTLLSGATTCTGCSQGDYCPPGTVVPRGCPPGTYGASAGLFFVSDCTLCPANAHCPLFGMAAPASSETAITVVTPAGASASLDFKTCESGYICPVRTAYR